MKAFKTLLLTILISLILTPIALASTCVFAWKDEPVRNNVSVYESEYPICMVEIKAATHIYTFTEDGCDSGYCVTGIGTTSAVATTDTRSCIIHDISNVSYYIDDDPTPVHVTSFKRLTLFQRIFTSLENIF